jgi:4a-hydroxytetrahydrobiopterin dehydratase
MPELLQDDELQTRLAGTPGWEQSGDTITKTLDCGDFAGAVERLNRITEIAQEMNHHPDVAISWKDLTLTLTSHSAGGLTDGDFELARRIDALH